MNAYDEVIQALREELFPVLAQAGAQFARSERATDQALVGVFFRAPNFSLGFCEQLEHKDSYYVVGGSRAPLSLASVLAEPASLWQPIEWTVPRVRERLHAAYRSLRQDEFKPYSWIASILAKEVGLALDVIAETGAGMRAPQGHA